MQRARIVLHSADRLPALEVARRAEVSRPAVWRWQRHYAEGGVERLLREGSRKPGKPPVPLPVVAKVVAFTGTEPTREVTHWTGRARAQAVGLSLRTVQRIWEAHHLQPPIACAPSSGPRTPPSPRRSRGTWTHDYKRHGTTTLFAAFSILDGAVFGRCLQQHTRQEFICFLQAAINRYLDELTPTQGPSSGPSLPIKSSPKSPE